MDNSTQNSSPQDIHSVSSGKERELVQGENNLRDLTAEVELPVEVKSAGVTVNKEQIEISPDLKTLGVSPMGVYQPLPATPVITLPLTDEKIEEGLNRNIMSALRWLAQWCLYRMKKFHLTLKVIHGKVMRVRYK